MIFMIRRQLIALLGFCLIAVFVCGLQLKNSYFEQQALYASVQQSLDLEGQAWRWLSLRPSEAELGEVRAQMEKLEPEHRRAALRRVVQALDERSALRPKVEFLQKTEQEYRRYQSGRLAYADQHLTFVAMCLTFLMIGTIVALAFYMRRMVFAPLNSLSRKMTDFLHDRYTYQFAVPSANELGHLQATFNSLAQRVLRNMEDLTTLDHAKSEFLSIASHELRTPLTSIKGSLSLLKSGVVGSLNEMATNLLNIAEMETDRLIRLINELLDLAKIEAGKFEVRPDWHSLSDLVGKTFASLEGLAQSAKVHLKAEELPPVNVLMDQDRIQQVLTNLLSNAIKFSPQGSSVDVLVEMDDKQALRISVRDHGQGIAPEDQELIFQKFRQATSAKNPLVKGTGLGLAIAKALVEEHGGQIGVHSIPGEGSTFYFTLPQWQFNRKAANHDQDTTTGVAA
ncbi:MAG: sensor histidine kinase [Bdellovibrionales bacterium]